jgi:hypothetical protein
MLMRFALFWGIKQRRMVSLYGLLGQRIGPMFKVGNVGKGLPFDAEQYPIRNLICSLFFLLSYSDGILNHAKLSTCFNSSRKNHRTI